MGNASILVTCYSLHIKTSKEKNHESKTLLFG